MVEFASLSETLFMPLSSVGVRSLELRDKYSVGPRLVLAISASRPCLEPRLTSCARKDR